MSEKAQWLSSGTMPSMRNTAFVAKDACAASSKCAGVIKGWARQGGASVLRWEIRKTLKILAGKEAKNPPSNDIAAYYPLKREKSLCGQALTAAEKGR